MDAPTRDQRSKREVDERQLTLADWERDQAHEAKRPSEAAPPESMTAAAPHASHRADEAPAFRPLEAGAGATPALLTTEEAASLLHVHPRTVQRLVERGQLAAVHIGSAVRFDPQDVDALIAGVKSQRHDPRPSLSDPVRAGRGHRVSFADRLRSSQHEHRAAHA
jgi:excisionase family DNA binding protein